MQPPETKHTPGEMPPPAQGLEPRRKHRGRFGRFFRGYLMAVGALTTAYVLVRLLVILLLEISKWV